MREIKSNRAWRLECEGLRHNLDILQQCNQSQSLRIERLNARVKELEHEVEILRLYGNKDCTAKEATQK